MTKSLLRGLTTKLIKIEKTIEKNPQQIKNEIAEEKLKRNIDQLITDDIQKHEMNKRCLPTNVKDLIGNTMASKAYKPTKKSSKNPMNWRPRPLVISKYVSAYIDARQTKSNQI